MFRPIPLIIDIDIYSYFCPSKTNRNKYETDSYDVVCFGIYALLCPLHAQETETLVLIDTDMGKITGETVQRHAVASGIILSRT